LTSIVPVEPAAIKSEILGLTKLQEKQKAEVKFLQDKKREQALSDKIEAAQIQLSKAKTASEKEYWNEELDLLNKQHGALYKINKQQEIKNRLVAYQKVIQDSMNYQKYYGKETFGYKLATKRIQFFSTLIVKLRKELKDLNTVSKEQEGKGVGFNILSGATVKNLSKMASTLKTMKNDGDDVIKNMTALLNELKSKVSESMTDIATSFNKEIAGLGNTVPGKAKELLSGLLLSKNAKDVKKELISAMDVQNKLIKAQEGTSGKEKESYQVAIGLTKRLLEDLNNIINARKTINSLTNAKNSRVEIKKLNAEGDAYDNLNSLEAKHLSLLKQLEFYKKHGRDRNSLESAVQDAEDLNASLKRAGDSLNKLLMLRDAQYKNAHEKGISEPEQKNRAKLVEETDQKILKGREKIQGILNDQATNQLNIQKLTTAQFKTQRDLMNGILETSGNFYKTMQAQRKDYIDSLDDKGITGDKKQKLIDNWDKQQKKQIRESSLQYANNAKYNPFINTDKEHKDNVKKLRKTYTSQKAINDVKLKSLKTELDNTKTMNQASLALLDEYNAAKLEKVRIEEEKEAAIKKENLDYSVKNTDKGLGMALSLTESFYKISGEKSKAAFKTMQAIEIAQTLVNTYANVVSAYKSAFTGVSTPYSMVLGASFAAVALAQGMAQVAAIKQQHYASGGLLTGGSGKRDDLYLGAASGAQVFAMGGEYILNKTATKSIGVQNLDYMNKTGNIKNSGNTFITINNESGMPVDLKEVSRSKNDKGDEVIGYVMKAIETNINFRRALKAV